MNCCRQIFCCEPRFREIDERTELTSQKWGRSNAVENSPVTALITPIQPKLPRVHVTNVSTSFVAKLTQCKTTPVPSLGSYGVPFPAMNSVHISQDTDTSLKIVAFQSKPFDSVETSIKLHHVIFPDYDQQNDPGEGYFGRIKINEINVNGVRKSAAIQQTVIVHDELFSPKLKPLVYTVGDESATVSAIINMPTLSQSHLYYGIEQIKMLNVILPSETLANLSDDLSIDTICNLIDSEISLQIQRFSEGNADSV